MCVTEDPVRLVTNRTVEDRLSGTLSLTLTTPGGAPVNPAIAASDPNITYTRALTDTWLPGASYLFTDMPTGTWQLAVTGDDTGGAEVPFITWAMISSTLRLDLPSFALSYQMNDTLPLTATLSGGSGLAGVMVQAIIQRADGITETLVLFDDGGHGDGAAGDGVYGNGYAIPAIHGYYLARVVATGTQGGVPFSRQAQELFMVAADTVSLTGSYADYPVDADGNGLYEALALDTGIHAIQVGTYTLSAWLVGAGETHIAQATHYTTLTTGTQTVTLHFDGDLIRAAGLDGPYIVSEVYLADHNGGFVLADSANDVWTTAAYDHSRFGTGRQIYLPLILKSYSSG